MSVDAVGSRYSGDVDDVLEVGTVRPRVDRRRLSDRGFGETTDARERGSLETCRIERIKLRQIRGKFHRNETVKPGKLNQNSCS